jgi:hypothetical protein
LYNSIVLKIFTLFRAFLAYLREKESICPVPFLFQVRPGNKAQGCGIDAISQTRRGRSVIEQMAQMGIAMFTAYFGAHHK